MNAFDELGTAFRKVQRTVLTSAPMRRVQAGEIALTHYASYLRQVFHHTRENPQIQALATVYFRGHQRTSIKRFFRHASAELGHDQLALNDLRTLGSDVSLVPYENPLPETTALIAFPFHQIYNLNPVGYLGYLYFLEFLPTGAGAEIMNSLERAGVPRTAMTFLHDHATIDVAHNRMMQGYAADLIATERDLRSAIYAMRVTGALYGRMIEGALAHADAPDDFGMSAEECREELGSDARFVEQTGERPRVVWPLEEPSLPMAGGLRSVRD